MEYVNAPFTTFAFLFTLARMDEALNQEDLIVALWLAGADTALIAIVLGTGESDVAAILWKWRERKYRSGIDHKDNGSLPAIRK